MWQGTTERVAGKVSVALRVEDHTAFGTLHWVEGTRVMLEVDGDFAEGAPAELRFDLTPQPGTVLAQGAVQRRLVTGVGEMQRYVIGVEQVEDEAKVEAWLEHLRTGGTAQEFSFLSTPRGEPEPQATPSEARRALESMDARLSGSNRPWSPSLVAAMGGRERLRQALRRVVSRRLGVGPNGLPRRDDPTYRQVETEAGTVVEVSWSSDAAFQEDLREMLVHHVLVVAEQGTALPDTGPLQVRLRHAAVDVTCSASVTDRGPFGATFNLALAGSQLATLLRSRVVETVEIDLPA